MKMKLFIHSINYLNEIMICIHRQYVYGLVSRLDTY